MTKTQKIAYTVALMITVMCIVVPQASAMHIMEGYLSGGYCIAWGAVCLPFLAAGFVSIKKRLKEESKSIVLLAISGAFIFVISSLKIPSVTGSCSHMTGTGLGAILFGPAAVTLLGLIVLIFQAILLAHGGLTSLGANTFSMAIAGPLVSWGIFALSKRLKLDRRIGVFLAAFLGDLFTYCVTSIQLALAHPSANGVMPSFVKFLGVFAPTQIPLAVLEGILTVIIIIALENYAPKDLAAVGYKMEV